MSPLVKAGMIFTWLILPFSGGLVGPFVFWLYWVRPKGVDEQGLVMHFGRRMLWRDYVDTRLVKLMSRAHGHVGWRLELKFKNGIARLDSITWRNFDEAAAMVERGIGKKLIS